MLHAILQKRHVEKAFDQFERKLNRGRPYIRTLGHQGNSGEYEVRWHAKYGFWHCFDIDEDESNRYWCAYGIDDPTQKKCLDITCEINMPFEGIHKNIAALFAKDKNGSIYLCHNGKIGGGRKGISKNAFWTYFGENNAYMIIFTDELFDTRYVIARIDSPHLMESIAKFVKEIDFLKKEIMLKNEADMAKAFNEILD